MGRQTQSEFYFDEWGIKVWYLPSKGKWHFHRLDGPAVENPNRGRAWWVNGKRLNNKEVESWLAENNVDLKTEEGQMAFKLRFS